MATFTQVWPDPPITLPTLAHPSPCALPNSSSRSSTLGPGTAEMNRLESTRAGSGLTAVLLVPAIRAVPQAVTMLAGRDASAVWAVESIALFL